MENYNWKTISRTFNNSTDDLIWNSKYNFDEHSTFYAHAVGTYKGVMGVAEYKQIPHGENGIVTVVSLIQYMA